jgi:hypothetical protein
VYNTPPSAIGIPPVARAKTVLFIVFLALLNKFSQLE